MLLKILLMLLGEIIGFGIFVELSMVEIELLTIASVANLMFVIIVHLTLNLLFLLIFIVVNAKQKSMFIMLLKIPIILQEIIDGSVIFAVLPSDLKQIHTIVSHAIMMFVLDAH